MNHEVEKVANGHSISAEESENIFDEIMSGQVSEDIIEKFLLAMNAKGETVDEVVGAARSLRKHMTRIQSTRTDVIDTCGTGGSGAGTFNISTASAIVTAAAGVAVAKHGNRKISSKSGSADVLEQLGVNLDAEHETIERCLNELGICFCFAQRLHPSMRHVGPVRRKLGVPTIFNLLGPLCNPAFAPYQLLGVGKPERRELIGQALAQLGTERAAVVHSQDGLCELSNSAPTDVSMVHSGETTSEQWSPSDFGLEPSERNPLLVESPDQSADIIQAILDGATGAPRDIVVLNSAAAIWLVGKANSPTEAAQVVSDAIDSGKAKQVLNELARLSHS